MAKQLFHDIVPPEKKSIKSIPIPERGRGEREPSRDVPPPPPPQTPRRKQSHRKKAPIIFTVIALLAIIALIIVFLPKTNGATITITPRGQVISVNTTFSASKDAGAKLPYQVAAYEKEGKLSVAATETEFAEIKASGVIRIFNNYSTVSQKLIENTRFETPSGKIFRITQAVTIPGKVGDTPGSIDVAVTADKVGAEYNVGLADFKIPGFKGDPRFDKIFARSKTAIAGGFSGNRKKVDQAEIASARQKIRDELQVSLLRQMQEYVPDNFVFPSSAYFVEFESLPDIDIAGGVELRERGTFHGIMFERRDLAQAITEKIGGKAESDNDIFGVENLGFSIKNGTSTKPWDSDVLNFTLNGTTTLVSAINTDALIADIAGKPRKSFSAMLTSYPGVAKAQVIIRPFWKQSFPTNKSEISIIILQEPIPQ